MNSQNLGGLGGTAGLGGTSGPGGTGGPGDLGGNISFLDMYAVSVICCCLDRLGISG